MCLKTFNDVTAVKILIKKFKATLTASMLLISLRVVMFYTKFEKFQVQILLISFLLKSFTA